MRQLHKYGSHPKRNITGNLFSSKFFFKMRVYWRNLMDILNGWYLDKKTIRAFGSLIYSNASTSAKKCLYASYSPSSVVTEMVLCQLKTYCEQGFSIIFISMSDSISEVDREKLKAFCTHIISRKSFGRDFGAWADAIRLLEHEIRESETLLFTNDSLLGPLSSVLPWLQPCLVQNGFFGLIESQNGGVHLQSFFLVANGKKVVLDAIEFLLNLKLTHSKWLMVQRGEISFAKKMQTKGNFVAAVLDYEKIENVIIEKPELLSELVVFYPELLKELNAENPVSYRFLLRSRLSKLSLNPCHQLNYVLLKHFHFPFVKVELMRNYAGVIPSAPDWRYYITEDSPVSEKVIDDHLASL